MRNYIGIPFKPHGRDRDGVDCWGLLCLIYREQFGIELPSYTEQYEEIDGKVIAGIVEWEMPCWSPVVRGEERLGDGILLRIKGEPMHVGMIIQPGTMIHIIKGVDSAIEDYRTRKWHKRVLGIYRYRAEG